jgi:RIO kinase 1
MSRPNEKWKTSHTVFDEFTNRNIYKLITEGYFKGLIGPVSVGKESNVFSAQGHQDNILIVKIYRLETADFNRMYDYIKYDPRYDVLKKKRREIIFAWAQREYRNLLLARDANIRVPTPITLKHNILVMECIGDHDIAPMLKDSIPDDPEKFCIEVVQMMKRLYKAGFVHADLSSFNILNWNEHPVFIDFSQATPLKSPVAEEYLLRDIKNVSVFFKKVGVDMSQEQILARIKH